MDPEVLSFKHDGIYIELWSAEELDASEEYPFIISCMGMPSHPHQHSPEQVEALLGAGYVVAYPHYQGSWGSSGVFSWEGCVDTVGTVVEFIRSGSATAAFDQECSWSADTLHLLGGSFGGSVVLVAGAKLDVDKIVAVAPVADWSTHFEETEEGKELLRGSIERVWDELWRVPDTEWERLERSDLSPVDYVDRLRKKHVLLIHGEKDNIVPIAASERLASEIDCELLRIDDEHRGSSVVGEAPVRETVLELFG